MFASRMIGRGWMAAALLAALSGCATPEAKVREITDVTTTVHFRQVCVTDKPPFDECKEIDHVLQGVPCRSCQTPKWQLVKIDRDTENGSALWVYEGTATLHEVDKLTDLNKLYTRIDDLRKKSHDGAVADFALQDRSVALEFCSNYVKSSLWTTIRGQTLPCACVELWLPNGQRIPVQLDEKGHWTFKIRLEKDKNWVYGVSRVLQGVEKRERAIEKHFRVNVHSSAFEQLTKEQFDELRHKEP